MAKRGILQHPKTMELAQILGIMDCYAVGILECFWQWVANYHPDGDVTGTNPAIFGRAIGYQGDAEQVWSALISANFIDCINNQLVVHDWAQHAEDSVHVKLARARQMFADGTVPKCGRLAKVERDEIQRYYADVRTKSAQDAHGKRTASAQSDTSVRTESAQDAHDVRTKSASCGVMPMPTPMPMPMPTPQSDARAHEAPLIDELWPKFKQVATDYGMACSEPEWEQARQWAWVKLDYFQQAAAIKGIKDRQMAGDSTLVNALPKNYLQQRMWQRNVKQPQQHARPLGLAERLARGEQG